MSLEAGGSNLQLLKEQGTPNAVQVTAFGSALDGTRLTTPQSSTVLMQFQDGSAEFKLSITKFWVKVSGSWLETTPWIKIDGVWKPATPSIKIDGVWK